VIPTTLAGVVLFLAGIGPGLFYVRQEESRVARGERSALLEVVELLVIGAVVTTLWAAIVWLIARETGWIDPTSLRQRPGAYVVDHPVRVASALLAVFMFSCGTADIAARIRYRGQTIAHYPGTVWQKMLAAPPNMRVWATVELKDGRSIQGRVEGFTLGASDGRRDLALGAPLRERSTSGVERALISRHMIVPEAEIRYIAAQRLPRPDSVVAAETQKGVGPDRATQSPA
jgi:hypothetical protein